MDVSSITRRTLKSKDEAVALLGDLGFHTKDGKVFKHGVMRAFVCKVATSMLINGEDSMTKQHAGYFVSLEDNFELRVVN